MGGPSVRRPAGAVVLLGILGFAFILPQVPVHGEKPDDRDEPIELAPYYGFEKLEIFKLERRSANLQAGDLNGDGRTDLLLSDNSHSRLDLLQQRKHKPETGESAVLGDSRVNVVKNDWRFRHRKLPVDKEIAATAPGDFNDDGRTDIAYFGTPEQLVILFQPESGDWTAAGSRTFRLPDVQAVQWILAAGDLNGDAKDDLVTLGKHETYLLYQHDDGLKQPERLMNTSEDLKLAHIADLDGDGRNDLCYLSGEDKERPFCARLQEATGSLGPELRFELNQPRGLSLFNVDGKPGVEILSVDSRTGRVEVHKLQRPTVEPGELAGRLTQYGFGRRGRGNDRSVALGDLDGDGLTDAVVTDPEAARMLVFRQRKTQGLDLGTPYPGLMETGDLRAADLDGDGADELVVLSTREKTIGLSEFQDGRLSFPRTLPARGEPLVLELADVDGDGTREIVYITRPEEGSRSEYVMQALQQKDGSWTEGDEGVSLKLRGTPKRMKRLDANRDDRPDFLVFPGLDREPHLFVLDENGKPVEVTEQEGIRLGSVSPGSVFIRQSDPPVILVAQDNFARNLQLDDERNWRVIDQYNADESDAEIAGAAAIDLDGKSGDEIVLIDTGVGKLRVLREEGSLYRPWREVDLGDFPYKSARVGDLNADEREDLLLFGEGRFAVLYAGRTDPTLTKTASFETQIEDAYFADVIAGDLNGDGRPDLAAIDTRSHYVEILNYDAEAGLRHALHFKLFESKSFSGSGDPGSEPRESLIADVTADGRADLILLTHDRVLLYPQDEGR